jgi:hypothetical protein
MKYFAFRYSSVDFIIIANVRGYETLPIHSAELSGYNRVYKKVQT